MSTFKKGFGKSRNFAMKKLVSLTLAVVLALAMVACNNTATDDTTPTTTTAPSTTTTKPTNPDPIVPSDPVAETAITGIDIGEVFSMGNNLQSVIDQASITLTNMTPFSENEGVKNLFNGTTLGDKLAGNVSGTVEITWKTTSETTVQAYAMITGGDSATNGRLPYSWEFFGSKDNGATWVTIDKVEISSITKSSNASFGYYVDKTAAYTSYKLAISAVSEDGTAASGTALQLNELILIGTGTGTVAETIVTDATAIDAMMASGTDLTSNVKNPSVENLSLWGDGAVANAFDGDYVNTKLGGNGNGISNANVYWTTNVATTVKNYIIYSGNDSDKWGRTPQAWVLFGSTDGQNWVIIDYVSEAGLPKTAATPYGYTVDSPAAYTHYALSIMSVADQNSNTNILPGATQFNELVLIGDAAAN